MFVGLSQSFQFILQYAQRYKPLEFVITHFYPDMFRESVFYSVKALVATRISRIHGESWGRSSERNRCFFPILGVSPVPGTGFTSFGSCQAGGCSSSIAVEQQQERQLQMRHSNEQNTHWCQNSHRRSCDKWKREGRNWF